MKFTAKLACILSVLSVVALATPSEARLAANRLAANSLEGNRLSGNRLAANTLAGDGAFTDISAIELPNGQHLTR
jgi:hypothetical protein